MKFSLTADKIKLALKYSYKVVKEKILFQGGRKLTARKGWDEMEIKREGIILGGTETISHTV